MYFLFYVLKNVMVAAEEAANLSDVSSSSSSSSSSTTSTASSGDSFIDRKKMKKEKYNQSTSTMAHTAIKHKRRHDGDRKSGHKKMKKDVDVAGSSHSHRESSPSRREKGINLLGKNE